jgi:hypothetical protein
MGSLLKINLNAEIIEFTRRAKLFFEAFSAFAENFHRRLVLVGSKVCEFETIREFDFSARVRSIQTFVVAGSSPVPANSFY